MLAGNTGPIFGRNRPIEHGRLVNVPLINGLENIYLIQKGLIAVLDGDVVLEPSCYEIDDEAGIIRLKRPPAVGLKLLIQ